MIFVETVRKEKREQGQKSSYDRIIKYTGVFGGVQTLVNLITLVKGKLVALFIGPAGMGITYAFNRTIDLVCKTTDLGISFSAVKTIAEKKGQSPNDLAEYNLYSAPLENEICVVRSWSLWLGLLGSVLCFLMAPLFSRMSFDGDYSYTLSFRLLAVVVGCTSVMGGERAILKGLGQLKQFAMNQIWVVVATLVISTPIYMWKGMQGIVPVLVLTSLCTLAITCSYSFRAYPYRIRLFSKKILLDGSYIIRLGINYTVAGFLGAGSLFLVSSYMLDHGSAEDVGFYSNAVVLASYVGMLVFSAVETDFFPRLSAVNKDMCASRQLVNEQTEVLVLLITPIVSLFLVFLPIIIPLLLKRSFLPMLNATQWAALALFLTALTRPLSFMSLSKGDSLTYLLQELFYDMFMMAAVICGYHYGGLEWAGVALFLSAVFDWILNAAITHTRYDYHIGAKVFRLAMLNGLLLIAITCVLRFTNGWVLYVGETVLTMLSCGLSVFYLNKETDFLQKIWARFNIKKHV